MTIEIITYHVASGNPKPGFEWTAYVVLPNGEYWHVRFNGPTAEIARSKAIALWTKENAKWERLGLNDPPHEDILPVQGNAAVLNNPDPWAVKLPGFGSGRGKHFAGKVWMRNGETLKRVALTEIALYEKNGFTRLGPRSK